MEQVPTVSHRILYTRYASTFIGFDIPLFKL